MLTQYVLNRKQFFFKEVMTQMQNPRDLEVTVTDFSDALTHENACILDVREPWEVAKVCLPGSVNIPVNQLEDEIDALRSEEKTIFVICHHGIRSLWACLTLQKNGITNVRSVRGGIDLYAQSCDTSLKRY